MKLSTQWFAFGVAIAISAPAFAQLPYAPLVPGAGSPSQAPFTATGTIRARSAADRARDVGISVLDEGAACNGVADDTAGFNAAIAKANSSGNATIFIPATNHDGSNIGPCELNGPLATISANDVGILGQSGGQTKIVQNVAGAGGFTWSNASPSASIANQIYGGSLTNVLLMSTVADTSGVGLNLIRPQYFNIDNASIQNFYSQITIQGGGAVFGANTQLTNGTFYTGAVSGSNLLHLQVMPVTGAPSGYEWPNGINFTNINWMAAVNPGSLDFTDRIIQDDGSDGVYISNGTLGFAGGQQVLLAPKANNAPIQSFNINGVKIDGGQNGTGLSIPAITTTGSNISNVTVTGGSIENQAYNAVDIREPTADVTLDTEIRNDGGWGIYNYASNSLVVHGRIADVGFGVNATVAISEASPGVVAWSGVGALAVANEPISFQTTGALPLPLVANTTYYVVGASVGTDFVQVSAHPGGPAIATTTSGSGTHTAYLMPYGAIYNGTIGQLNMVGLSLEQVYGAAFTPPTAISGTAYLPPCLTTDGGGTIVPGTTPPCLGVPAAHGNAVILNSASVTIAASSTALTVTGANFSARDVGKQIRVPFAGASGGLLATTIAAYTSTTQVTLAAAAQTAVSARAETIVYAWDDTVAIQSALSTYNTVDLACGAYFVTSTLVGQPNASLIGQSPYCTKIVRTDPFGDTLQFGNATTVAAEGVDVENIWFDEPQDYVYGTTTAIPFSSGPISYPVTISNGAGSAPGVVTFANEILAAPRTPVTFSVSGGSLPSPLVAGTTYYVVGSSVEASSFSVAATPDGAAIETSSAGSGTFAANMATAAHLRIFGGRIPIIKHNFFYHMPYGIALQSGFTAEISQNTFYALWDPNHSALQEGIAGVGLAHDTVWGEIRDLRMFDNQGFIGFKTLDESVTVNTLCGPRAKSYLRNISEMYNVYMNSGETAVFIGDYFGSGAYNAVYIHNVGHLISDVRFTSNYFDGNANLDFSIRVENDGNAANYSRHLRLTDNHFNGENQGLGALYVDNPGATVSLSDLVVSGNVLHGYIGTPMIDAGASDAVFSGNIVSGNGVVGGCATDPSIAAGLYVTGSSTYTTTSANTWGGDDLAPLTSAFMSWGIYTDVANGGAYGPERVLPLTNSLFGAPSATVTISEASPAVVAWPATLPPVVADKTAITFSVSGGGSLPSPLAAGVPYFVIGSSISGDTFEVSASSLVETAVNTTTAGSGAFTASVAAAPSGLQNFNGGLNVAGPTGLNGETSIVATAPGFDALEVSSPGSTNFLAFKPEAGVNELAWGYWLGGTWGATINEGSETVQGSLTVNGAAANLNATTSVTGTTAGTTAFEVFSNGSTNFLAFKPENVANELVWGYYLGSSNWGLIINEGAEQAEAFKAGGSAPTATGSCAVGTQVGGNTAGTFKATTGCTGTVILTFATTAIGWTCQASNQTTPTDLISQTGSAATTATFTGAMASSDVISFACTAY